MGDTTDLADTGGEATMSIVSPSGVVLATLPHPMSAFIGFVKTA